MSQPNLDLQTQPAGTNDFVLTSDQYRVITDLSEYQSVDWTAPLHNDLDSDSLAAWNPGFVLGLTPGLFVFNTDAEPGKIELAASALRLGLAQLEVLHITTPPSDSSRFIDRAWQRCARVLDHLEAGNRVPDDAVHDLLKTLRDWPSDWSPTKARSPNIEALFLDQINSGEPGKRLDDAFDALETALIELIKDDQLDGQSTIAELKRLLNMVRRSQQSNSLGERLLTLVAGRRLILRLANSIAEHYVDDPRYKVLLDLLDEAKSILTGESPDALDRAMKELEEPSLPPPQKKLSNTKPPTQSRNDVGR